MKVLLAGLNQNDRQPVEQLIDHLGYESEVCHDPNELWDILSTSCKTSIILLPIQDDSWCSDDVLKRLRSLRADQALYLIGTSSEEGNYLKALERGVNDHIALCSDIKVLEQKFVKAKEAVVDKQSLLETSEVLERYSQHIDRIAEERARQLIHAERLSTLGVMSAGIAHEINTPLGFISTSLEAGRLYWDEIEKLIKTEIPEDKLTEQQVKMLDRMPKALERIERGLEKVNNVTIGLKNFGRASRTPRDVCNLHTCIHEAIEVAEHAVQKSAEIRLHLADTAPIISGQSQQIEQVIVNLMVNAAHALEEHPGDRFIDITTTQTDGWVTVVVEDNGPGIPDDIIDTIWNSFFTTKEEGKGTGLGLAISRGIIRDHSGSINVTNKEEGGARFEIRLPAHQKEA